MTEIHLPSRIAERYAVKPERWTGAPKTTDTPPDPRLRAAAVGLRAALLMAADVLGEYAGLPKRTIRVE